ncbi:MAG TPA: GDSL-type esterase/lipase family protein [Patescibacteria group bacterium]|nr:GDSL-type esterase/lipase family protein [Patescibacteria group bacterium]
MLQKLVARWRRAAAGLLLCLCPLGIAFASGGQTNTPDPNWVSPGAAAIQKINAATSLAPNQPVFQTNLDCSNVTYRLLGDLSKTMHQGCFAQTAFGLLDIDDAVAIPNGMSEAMPVHGFNNWALTPLPNSAAVGSLSPAPVWGSYLHFYTYFPGAVEPKLDITLQPYWQVSQPPNATLTDMAGQPLAVNTQTMAYSSGGSWLVAESPMHAFMRVNTATFDTVPFASPFTTQAFDFAQHNSQVAVSEDGRYVAVESNEFNTFRVYDLSTCTGTVTTDTKPLDCQSHDYWPYVNSHIAGLMKISHVRFMNEGLLSFNATSSDGAGAQTNTYVLASSGSITNLLDYLGLGDSYTSGEGAFDYLAGADTPNDMCHLSSHSYPLLLVRDLFTDTSGHSVACSGAVIRDVYNEDKKYAGQVSDRIPISDRNVNQLLSSFSPGYLPQYEFVKQYQPKIITVSVGGDDIGFGDILASCISPLKSIKPPGLNPNNCYSTWEDQQELMTRIDATYPKWTQLYHQLESIDPGAQIYAIGYPHIAEENGNCALNVHLTDSEITFSEGLIDYLNAIIEDSATSAGVTYIDISHALDGHRLCEAKSYDVAVNGVTAGTDKYHVFGKESFHPNALGHELIEQAILKQTNHFASSAPVEGSASTSASQHKTAAVAKLQTGAKTGRAIQQGSYGNLGSHTIIRGTSAGVTVGGLAHSLKPHATYSISLDRGATLLGTVATDENGDINTAVTIPFDTEPGVHTIDVSGQDLANEAIYITQTVYVNASSDDYDGDGIPNGLDSCPDMLNSGQDADQDGVDDACDGFIGLTVTTNSGGSQTPTSDSSTESSSVSTAGGDNNPASLGPTASNSIAVASSPRVTVTPAQMTNTPVAGAVLGVSTTTPGSKQAEELLSHLVNAKDNLRVIYWLPWAIDAGLLLLLFTLLSMLFGRLSRKVQ